LGIILIILGGLWLLAAAFPRLIWQLSTAWKYENPENVQPSSAYLAVSSLTTGVAGVVLVGIGIFLASTPSPEEIRADQEQQQQGCADLLAEFGALAVWGGDGQLVNPGALRSLAVERDVQLNVRTVEVLQTTYDLVSVADAQGEGLFVMSRISRTGC